MLALIILSFTGIIINNDKILKLCNSSRGCIGVIKPVSVKLINGDF